MIEIILIIFSVALNLGILLIWANRERNRRISFMYGLGNLVEHYINESTEKFEDFNRQMQLLMMERNMSIEE